MTKRLNPDAPDLRILSEQIKRSSIKSLPSVGYTYFPIILSLILFIFVNCAVAQTVWNGSANTAWYNTSATTFTINTAEQLAGLAELVNNGNSFSGKTVKLGANIILNDTYNWQSWSETNRPANTWMEIGIGTNNIISDNPFKGTFDGDNHIVSGVYINSTDDFKSHGFFSILGVDGIIKNLGVVDSYIKGVSQVGGLVGQNIGTVINSYSAGAVTGEDQIGGLVGVNSKAAAFSGYELGTIINSYSSGIVTGRFSIGGLVGSNGRGTISSSYSISVVTGKAPVGFSSSALGGLVGNNGVGTINNSYSTGAVTGTSDVGGLVGYNPEGTVNNSYSAGTVTGTSDVGGLVGNSYGTVSNSYYDKTTSRQTDAGKGEGKTTAEMKLKSTYAGWDFQIIWGKNNSISNGYPYLRIFINGYIEDDEDFFGVTNISNIPTTSTYGETIILNGTVSPENATNKTIIWAVVNGNAIITGNSITFNSAGSVEIKATISNGISDGVNFEKNFIINVDKANGTGIVSIEGWIYGSEPNTPISANGTGTVSYMYKVQGADDATYSATIPTNVGNYTVQATFAESVNYLSHISTADFTITAKSVTVTSWYDMADTDWYTSDLSATEYTITTAEQLAGLARLVNNMNDFSGKTVKLGNDITLNDTTGWQDWKITPPANFWTAVRNNYDKLFQGTFDGDGHTISGVYINTTSDYQGLFGDLGSDGVIKNLGVIDSYIKGNNYVGGLVGMNRGTVSNSYSTGTVTGSNYVGDLVGYNRSGGTVNNSYSTGTVTGSYSVGGLAGYNSSGTISGTISNSYSTSTVIGNSRGGGLVGYNGGTISNSYSTGKVSGDSIVGGLVGDNEIGTISNSYSTGAVSGDSIVGGLVGDNKIGRISNSYYDSQTSGQARGYGTNISQIGEQTRNNIIGKTTIEMQSQGFTKLLNAGASLISMNAWTYSTGNYPKLTDTPSNTITSYFAGGDGTELNPYLIKTKEQLENLYYFVKIKDSNGEYFKLGNDIALNNTANWESWDTNPPDYSWTKIGTFRGTFDGDGYVVSGVYGNGLFGSLGSGGVIKNLGVVNSYVKGGSDVGGLVGYNSYGTVSNSYFTGTVTGSDSSVGGLVGYNYYGAVNNSYSTGEMTGNERVGGLVGYNLRGTVNNSYSTGKVIGNEQIGGLVGYNSSGTVSNSYSTGAVSGDEYVGGLIGHNYSRSYVYNSYSTGTVTGNSYVGGLVGYNYSGTVNYSSTVNNSYSTGTVTGSNSVGGLMGYNNNDIAVRNSYYDIQTSGQVDTRYGYGTGKTTAEMQSEGFVNILNFGATTLSMNAWVYAKGKYPELTNTSASTVNYFASGDGTEEDPYIIETKVQLETFSFLVNSGNDFNGEYFKLGNDIALNGDEESPWVAIGNSYDNELFSYNNSFRGTFDGDGYIISGVYINTTDNPQGLFGYFRGTIKNLGVVDSYIKGGQYIGGLVGYNSGGTISNSYSTSMVTGSGNYVGGLVGRNGGTISNSYSTSTVTGEYHVGGLVGFIYSGTVNNSYATGVVSGTGSIGGLVGCIDNGGTVRNSYSTGTVTGNSYVGGLVGHIYNGTVRNSYYDYQTSGQTDTRKGEGKTTAEMQSQSFVNLLNAGASLISMNAWVYSEVEYPVLSNTPASVTYFASGDGTEEHPYIITTKEHLENFSFFVYLNNNFRGKYFKLGNDIALNDTENWQNWETTSPANSWTAIGDSINPFRGTFNGDGHVVSGVYINNSSNHQGLFGYLGEGGIIKNLGVVNSYIKGGQYVSGLVGYNYYGTVSNSYFTGTVTGNGYVGGLMGYISSGTVNNSYSTGLVTGTGFVGGLVGFNGGTVSNSYYDKETSGQTDTRKGIGKTTLEMKQITTYANWDFRCIWDINNEINNGYPYLNIRIKDPIISDLNFTIPTNITYTGTPQNIGTVTGVAGIGAITVKYNGEATNPTNAGTYEVTAHIAEGTHFAAGVVQLGTFVIEKAHHNISHIVLNDHEVTHNGEEHCHVGHTGELPAGVTVVFENDHHCQSEEGSHKVKLTFVNNDPNYHDFDESHHLEALLNIVANTPTISAKPAIGGIIAQAIGKDIVLSNLPQNAKVEVFGLNGKRVGVQNFEPVHGALRITVQTKGVYVVKAGGQSLRVVVR